MNHLKPRPRPDKTVGYTERIQTSCGHLYITVNNDDEGLCEVFAQMGKTGGCASSQIEAISRLVSLALRSGINAENVIKQLDAIRCPQPRFREGGMILSCADAIAKVLKARVKGEKFEIKPYRNINVKDFHLQPGKIEEVPQDEPVVTGDLGFCPDCGMKLAMVEGCALCNSCGFSKCG